MSTAGKALRIQSSTHGDRLSRNVVIEFDVPDTVPPRKDGATSMWAKPSEVERLIALRARAKEKTSQPLDDSIQLSVELHLPDSQTRAAGDLDNYVTGICDGLMEAAPGSAVHERWHSPELAHIHPG